MQRSRNRIKRFQSIPKASKCGNLTPPVHLVDCVLKIGLCGGFSKKAKVGEDKNANRWSLSKGLLFLDERFDSGVKILESGSESSDGDDVKNEGGGGDVIDSSFRSMTPQSREKQVTNVQQRFPFIKPRFHQVNNTETKHGLCSFVTVLEQNSDSARPDHEHFTDKTCLDGHEQ